MSIQTAYSSNTNAKGAVTELANKIDIQSPKFILFFASSNYDPSELSEELSKTFNTSEIAGCTTAGEIISGKMLNNSIVAMAFDRATVGDIKIEVVENLSKNSMVDTALKNFEFHFAERIGEMNYKKYLGLVLVDGLCESEEKLMEELATVTNFPFIGGSAGDDLKFKQTIVFANGKFYTDAAVLVLIKLLSGFEVLKMQSFAILENKFIATKVNVGSREVLELDNKPAIEVYAKAVCSTIENAASEFKTYPLGFIIEGEPFVRSPQRVSGTGIKFYCNVAEGTELSLLRSGDIVEETKRVLDKKISENKKISGIINFHCILRTIDLKKKGQLEEYARLFETIPTIGFCTYGEQYIGHINQTSVMVLFK